MLTRKFVKPPRKPPLMPGDIFQTATGFYVVGMDTLTKSMREKIWGNWATIPDRYPISSGYMCFRIGGHNSPRISMFSHQMWQDTGKYRVLSKEEGIELIQELQPAQRATVDSVHNQCSPMEDEWDAK